MSNGIRQISKVASMDFGKIVRDTHREEWQRTFNSRSKTMDDFSIAREGGASEEVIDYLQESLEWDKIFS